MPKTELLAGIGLVALGVVGLYVLSRPAPDEDLPICTTAPPAPQPAVPGGWSMYTGAVSGTAGAEARASLSSPIGTAHTFEDDDGALLGILLMWHCHDPSEGVTPVGWHKGATLFRVG
jgi:hypothetical protein